MPRLRMDLKEIDINTRNWANSAQDRGLCECEIGLLGSINNGVSYIDKDPLGIRMFKWENNIRMYRKDEELS